MSQTATATKTAEKKSGIKKFAPNEVIFNENDPADSLYIIQRGQIRLYRPKGRGFIEIAILRAGEVIGEMAYFDEKASRRSCSAAALVTTEVIEISFKAFDKTMSGLNPWFKTIINTLADRLRKTNDKLKQIESNSIGYSKDGASDYKFFQNLDIIKLLSTFFLIFKSHGEELEEGGHQLAYPILKFYSVDVYAIAEVKLEEFKELMNNLGFLTITSDKEGNPQSLVVKDINTLRSMLIFINTQRMAEESKQIKLTDKALSLSFAIINQLTGNSSQEKYIEVNLTPLFERFKDQKPPIGAEEYKELVTLGMAKELVLGKSNEYLGQVDYQAIKKMYPSVRLMNAVQKVNETKAR